MATMGMPTMGQSPGPVLAAVKDSVLRQDRVSGPVRDCTSLCPAAERRETRTSRRWHARRIASVLHCFTRKARELALAERRKRREEAGRGLIPMEGFGWGRGRRQAGIRALQREVRTRHRSTTAELAVPKIQHTWSIGAGRRRVAAPRAFGTPDAAGPKSMLRMEAEKIGHARSHWDEAVRRLPSPLQHKFRMFQGRGSL